MKTYRDRESILYDPKVGFGRTQTIPDLLSSYGTIRWGDVDWIGLAQDRYRWRALANSVLNLRVP
jgi:hypothetical protein